MRKFTTSLIEMMDDGLIDARTVVNMCLDHMSEAEVKAMMEANDMGEDDPEPNPVYEAYEDHVCPDCGEDIPYDVADGDDCSNCGHVFTEYKEAE